MVVVKMGLARYNITCDSEVWDCARRLFPGQISGMINDYLRSVTSIDNKEKDIIQLEIERLELQKEQEQIKTLLSRSEERKRAIGLIERDIQQKQEQRLLKQKEEAEKVTRCSICDSITLDPKPFMGKILCRSCFLGNGTDKIKNG